MWNVVKHRNQAARAFFQLFQAFGKNTFQKLKKRAKIHGKKKFK